MAALPNRPPQRDSTGVAPRQPGGLPAWRTPLVGRERDLEQVLALARRADVPILTITGPGGAGKTRLAVAAARALAPEHADGAVFVPLSPVRDPAFVPVTVAQALGVPDSGSATDLLRDRDLVLVLDNLEHVLDATPMVAELIAGCPRLSVLCTSRIRLNLSGEHVYPLPGLAPHAAASLFEQRARALDPGFALTDRNAVDVAAICARLDGLPLAIELAAARVPALSPQALLVRLSHPLDALAGGPSDAPPRQRSLRDTIAWSHDLLDERERAVLRRLAVFTGGFALDAVEAVAGPEGDVLEALTTLVDGSLVRVFDRPDGTTRFVMLETIREYALERLVESGEEAAVRERHARHYLALSQSLESSVLANAEPVTEVRARRLHPDLDNLRGAIAWLLEHDPVAAARLASALDEYWFRFGYFGEGRRWLDQALARAPDMPAEVRRRVLDTSGWLAYQQGDLAEAEARLSEAATMHGASGDVQSHAWALGRLANVALARLEPERARRLLEEARQLGRQIGDRLIEIAATSDLGRVLMITGDVAQAEAVLREVVRQHRERPGTIGTAVSLYFLGNALLAGGKARDAVVSHRDALAIFAEAEDVANVARSAEGIARAVVPSDPAGAARLFGATMALREQIGHPVDGEDRPAIDRALTEARERLPRRAFDAAWSGGRALAWDAIAREATAVATALADAGAGERDTGLSAREREVLALLVTGRTDTEIAQALHISRRTTATHLRHIYVKLNVASRVEATATALRRGLA